MSGLNGSPANGSALAASGAPQTWVHHLQPPVADGAPTSDDEACAAECRRLEVEIAAAGDRAAAAARLRSEREDAMRAALRELLIASQEEVAELERQHEISCSEIRRAAQEEIERLRGGNSALPHNAVEVPGAR